MSVDTRDGVFVTVGTTSFDKLIQQIDTPDFLRAVQQKGYKSLTIQLGRGVYLPKNILPEGQESATLGKGGFRIEWFRFKPDLGELINFAGLVVSHAGAGSIFEALRASRRLLVVVNEDLMDNHQQELAEALSVRGHLAWTNVNGVQAAFENFDASALKPYPKADAAPFARAIDGLVGFSAAA